MSKFKVGDRVRPADECLSSFGTGTITDVGVDYAEVSHDADKKRRGWMLSALTLADPAPTGPRYVVRAAIEMREGESCYPFTVLAANLVDLFNSDPNESGNWKMREWAPRNDHGVRRVAAIVDTRPDSPAQSRTASPPPAPVAPPRPRPCDQLIVRAWEAAAQTAESGWIPGGRFNLRTATVYAGSVATVFVDYQQARSRELRRLAATSADRERLRVVVQCQDGGADDV